MLSLYRRPPIRFRETPCFASPIHGTRYAGSPISAVVAENVCCNCESHSVSHSVCHASIRAQRKPNPNTHFKLCFTGAQYADLRGYACGNRRPKPSIVSTLGFNLFFFRHSWYTRNTVWRGTFEPLTGFPTSNRNCVIAALSAARIFGEIFFLFVFFIGLPLLSIACAGKFAPSCFQLA